MNYNDLIDVQFEDAVTHEITDTSDILGLVMPYHWGPTGEVLVLNQQEFFDTFPEVKHYAVTPANAQFYVPYAQAKSYFQNGGSRIAVYRSNDLQVFGRAEALEDGDATFYATFKYPGVPCINEELIIDVTSTGDAVKEFTVTFKTETNAGRETVHEYFKGQIVDPDAYDEETGETTYLPEIMRLHADYLTLSENEPISLIDLDDNGYTPTPPAEPIREIYELAFGQSDSLIPTQFIIDLSGSASLKAYQTSVQFIDVLPDSPPTVKDRFTIIVDGREKIKVLNKYIVMGCAAGVAGAYARVAQEVNLNQVASAIAYGAYHGILVSTKSFQNVLKDSEEKGWVSVFTSNSGPQIFGVRNSYSVAKPGSYFGKCNVSRVLAAILRNVKPFALSAIHTATAADAVLRSTFETNLQGILDDFIASRCLQPDSIAICNGSNNSDKQTKGGAYLNIILQLHFIGLVERIKIKVVATDSSVNVEFA